MKRWPNNLKKLIQYFGRLPGIGPKMAERIVLFLQKQPQGEVKNFATLLSSLPNSATLCIHCFTLSEKNVCDICMDKTRDNRYLLIVGDPVSALNIENSEKYRGYYFILNGLLNPLEGIGPQKLNIKKLLERIKSSSALKEVILAFNANVEGEATLLYLKKILNQHKNIKLTRLARGLPMGSELSYADEITLSAAISERQPL